MVNQTSSQNQGQATSQGQGQQSAASQGVLTGYTSGMTTGTQGGTQQQGGAQMGAAQQGSAGQASQAVIGVFENKRQAEQAIQSLRQQGFGTEEISIVAKKGDKGGSGYVEDDITDGALTGGTLGGIGGLILGAGALAIPGVGPIIAAGPIAAALGGAVAGGVAGGLIDWGIPADVSERYEQEVAQGGVLAVVSTTGQKVNQAAQILRQNGAKNVESHSLQRQKNA